MHLLKGRPDASDSGSAGWRSIAVVLAFVGLGVALPATASAQETILGRSDLSAPPNFTYPCSDPCTLVPLEGAANPPSEIPTALVAPSDGTITELQVRAQQPVPLEIVQMDRVGQQLEVKSRHPVGTTSLNGVNTFGGLDIFAEEGTVLGVGVEPTGMATIDGYQTPGENGVGKLEPTPAQGEQGTPQAGFDNQPAIRLAFLPGKPPGDRVVDLQVTKERKGKRRRAVGKAVGFEVVVKNNGPDDATGVFLYDSYEDPDLLVRSAGPAAAGGACGPSPFGPVKPAIPGRPGAWGGNVVFICDVGNLAAGASVTYEFDFEVGPLPFDVQSKVVPNDAAADMAATPDSNYANNYAGAEIKVRRGGCKVRSVIDGTEGKDKLVGKRKPEAIYGLGKADKLKGKAGNDCLFGNEGGDKLVGGPDRDKIDGGDGNDVVNAVDGDRDKVDCGKGKRDRAKVDAKDRVKNCEKVRTR